MPFPNPKFEPPTHRLRPGAVVPSRQVPSQICAIFGQKTAIFCPKQPQKAFKTAKRRETAATLHVRLDFPVSKSPLVRSNSAICPRNGPKRRQKALKICTMCSNSPKQRTGRILGYVAQNPIPRGPSPPATPHFLWFPPPEMALTDT